VANFCFAICVRMCVCARWCARGAARHCATCTPSATQSPFQNRELCQMRCRVTETRVCLKQVHNKTGMHAYIHKGKRPKDKGESSVQCEKQRVGGCK
jgi:hypothetical protein